MCCKKNSVLRSWRWAKVCPKHVELIVEINKTVIVASRWFLYYLTYIDDARSNTNQTSLCLGIMKEIFIIWSWQCWLHIPCYVMSHCKELKHRNGFLVGLWKETWANMYTGLVRGSKIWSFYYYKHLPNFCWAISCISDGLQRMFQETFLHPWSGLMWEAATLNGWLEGHWKSVIIDVLIHMYACHWYVATHLINPDAECWFLCIIYSVNTQGMI